MQSLDRINENAILIKFLQIFWNQSTKMKLPIPFTLDHYFLLKTHALMEHLTLNFNI